MFTLENLNLVVGIGWDGRWNETVTLFFHEEEEGWTHKITAVCDRWTYRFNLSNRLQTAHLPSKMTFLLSELKVLVRRLSLGYKDASAVLPIVFSQDGFEIARGPGRDMKMRNIG